MVRYPTTGARRKRIPDITFGTVSIFVDGFCTDCLKVKTGELSNDSLENGRNGTRSVVRPDVKKPWGQLIGIALKAGENKLLAFGIIGFAVFITAVTQKTWESIFQKLVYEEIKQIAPQNYLVNRSMRLNSFRIGFQYTFLREQPSLFFFVLLQIHLDYHLARYYWTSL